MRDFGNWWMLIREYEDLVWVLMGIRYTPHREQELPHKEPESEVSVDEYQCRSFFFYLWNICSIGHFFRINRWKKWTGSFSLSHKRKNSVFYCIYAKNLLLQLSIIELHLEFLTLILNTKIVTTLTDKNIFTDRHTSTWMTARKNR